MFIYARRIDVAFIRGIAIFDDGVSIIGINNNDRYPTKSFSIIYELVYIIKHQSVTCNDMFSSFSVQQEEVFCNAVAGEVLVSSTALNAYFTANNLADILLADIETMAKRFNVSKEVITRRLFDTNYFTQDEYDIYANEIRQNFENTRQAQKIARQKGMAYALCSTLCCISKFYTVVLQFCLTRTVGIDAAKGKSTICKLKSCDSLLYTLYTTLPHLQSFLI